MPERSRPLAAVLAMLTIAFVAAGCGSSGGSNHTAVGNANASGSLKGHKEVFAIFEPDTEPAYSAAFVDKTRDRGLDVAYDIPVDYAKLETQVKSGNVSWTLVEADPWWAIAHCGQLIEPTGVRVPNLPSELDSGRCGLSGDTFAFMPAYDAKLFPTDPPKTWQDFFDTKKYPGKRAVWGSNAVSGIIEGALLADGVSPQNLYPLDIQRALRKLDTIKGSLTFYDTLAQALEIMQSRNAAFVVGTNIPGYAQAKEGGSFKPMWDHALLSWDAYVVPNGADAVAAKASLQEIARPANQAKFAELTGFGPASGDAKPKLNTQQDQWSPAGTRYAKKENQSLAIPMDQHYYAKHFDEVSAAWTQWVSG